MHGAETVFVDTNILIYAADARDQKKHQAAHHWLTHLWTTGQGRLSWQVLNEFYAVATRKIATSHEQARAVVLSLTAWQPVDTSTALVRRAWHWSDAAGISWWDSLIVAAAELSGSRWLLTEDMQEGASFDRVTVVSPFRTVPEDIGVNQGRTN
jgi:predicted nucleic acid-binding protein